jgi:dipeptidyl aminopeptidase/acylaminoacyl peptidase
MVKQHGLIALLIFAILGSIGLAVLGVRSMETNESPLSDVNSASILAVRAHPLTPGDIVTIKHVAARAGCPTSVVSYHSDGLNEFALATRPPVVTPKSGFPVIIFAHGYTNPATYKTDNTQYQTELQWYCQHGYLILKPDYRGHGSSEGAASNGLFAAADTYDVLNLVASLPSYPFANAQRVALVGHSMGGGIVLRAAVANHNLPIKAVVTLAGAVDSLPAMTFHWTGRVPPDVAIRRQEVLKTEGPPNQNPGYWHDASSINYLSALTAPLQINQGLKDSSVPPSFAVSLNTALYAASKTHEYYTYPDTGHTFNNPVEMSAMLTNSTTFLNQFTN